MPLKVMGFRLLIKPDPVKEQYKIPEVLKQAGFEAAMDADMEKRNLAATEIGTVVDVGPSAFQAYDFDKPGWAPWCKQGDRVTFARFAGKIVQDPVTDEKFFVINDMDVQCLVTGEANPFGE